MRRLLPAAALGLLLAAPAAVFATQPTFLCMTGKCHPSIGEGKYVHGPIGSGMCPLCHDEGREPERLPAAHPAVRIGKATEKCLLCHEEISALLRLGSIHTPVADGDCIDCHSPHNGEDSFFLHFPTKAEGGRRIAAETCRACHEAADPSWYDDFHAREAILDCVVCHNAHGSSERYQLTRYVRDVYFRSALQEGAEMAQKGKLDEAAEAYGRALSVFPDDAEAALRLADVHFARGEWLKARDGYEKVLASRPSSVEALIGAGSASRRLDGPGASLEHFRRALEVAPDRADLHVLVGEIYQERGQHQEALSQFSQAAELDPKLPEAQRGLAEALDSLDRGEEARKARERYRELTGE